MKNWCLPWTYRPKLKVVDSDATNSERQSGYGAYTICRLGGDQTDFPDETLDELGRLIEAAPDFLKALRVIAIECDPKHVPRESWEDRMREIQQFAKVVIMGFESEEK